MSAPSPDRSARARERDDASEREFLAPGLVHELQQPLTGLEAGLRLVERDLGPSVTQLEGWKIATSQLARVSETLRTYHRLMSPERTGDGPFLVEPIVRRCVDDLRHRIDASRARVSVVIEPDVPLAHGSPHALLHALTNLVANALDAVAETAEPGRIELRALRVVDAVPRAEIRVADEGAGIPSHRRERLFAPGFTTKQDGRGSGLGLAVSRRMLRRAGGELRLAAPTDPSRCPWSRTEFVVDLAASASAPALRERPPPARAGPRQAARAAALVAGLALALSLGWGGFRAWIRTGDAPATPVTAAAPRAVEVVSTEGRIERRRGNDWGPVKPGERLLADDGIRADAGAGATLAIGEGTRIVVSDATELTVREITAAVERVQLARGRISVDHQADGARVVVVESERGERVARAGTARFSVLASGAALAVATEAGVVRLQSAGETVEVPAGHQSIALAGEAPASPAPIPVSLLLRIARAAADAQGSCVIEGVVPAGAEVRIDGRLVEPGPHGKFTVRLPRAPGRERAKVATRDAAGRTVERRVRCADEHEHEHDVSDFAVRWGNDAPVRTPK